MCVRGVCGGGVVGRGGGAYYYYYYYSCWCCGCYCYYYTTATTTTTMTTSSTSAAACSFHGRCHYGQSGDRGLYPGFHVGLVDAADHDDFGRSFTLFRAAFPHPFCPYRGHDLHCVVAAWLEDFAV